MNPLDLLLWCAILVVSLGVLVKGSDWFTSAAERIGLALGMPAFMVGVTIVAVGTSLPEMISSVLAVIRDASEIVAGNVVGSNIANLLLVLALAAIVDGHIRMKFELVNVDLPFLMGSTCFLALVLWDGSVGRFEGIMCLAGLGIYLWYALRGRPPLEATSPGTPRTEGRVRWVRTSLILVGSAGLIYVGADFTVKSVIEIADIIGIGPELIAASAIALGTSLPEVAVTITAARRGQSEIAVGNVLGSNIFNAFAVVGVSALVGPLTVPQSIVGFALPVLAVATVLAFVMIMEKEITKWEGWLLILFYIYFIGALFGVM
ncbi:MAG: calcium/sodium antiporter [Pseudomonadota bacterium]